MKEGGLFQCDSEVPKHTVSVVLAHVDDRDIPQLGDVEGLVDLALVGSTIAIQRYGNVCSKRGGDEQKAVRPL